MDGLLIVDKPAGVTSHDVVDRVRRALGTRKVGHGGTLDPDATGVLVLGVGRATRFLSYAQASPKRYEARVKLGKILPWVFVRLVAEKRRGEKKPRRIVSLTKA